MNGDIFCDWLKHFINFVRPSLTQKVLLILDGHKSHTQNIEALEHASKSGVIMLSLPTHTTHKLQPLDVSFFKPLKPYYYQHLNQWMRAHPGRPVTMFQICQLFGKAYGQATTVGNAVNGFCKTGLFPVNPLVFDDSEFEPANVTDRPNPTEDEDIHTVSELNSDIAASSEDMPSGESLSINDEEANFPSASVIDDAGVANEATSADSSNSSASKFITVAEISPLPKNIRSSSQRRRPSAKATLLTSSPHKKRVKQQFEIQKNYL